ncbi:MAG TPA: glycosyltransferase family 4 protein [Gemmataceae bacterium]|nr:glycosyltransferase family 4 protein [Gemmataceae bacterium]
MSMHLATMPERNAVPIGLIGGASEVRRALVVVRWPVGGIRTHLLANYPIAAAAGWRFTFVGPADGSLDALRESLQGVPRTEYIGVPVKRRSCSLWPTVRGLVRDGGFDLIHSHGLTAAVHAVAANVGLRIPHVATLHEPLQPCRFSGLLGPFKRWALGRLMRRPDAIVVVSEDARANLLQYFPTLAGRPHRIATIPNGVRIRRPTDVPRDDSLRRRLGAAPDAALIGFLGRFMPEKGFSVLLEAVQRLAADPSAPPFHVAAFGSGDYRIEYSREVRRRGLSDRVTLLDFTPDVHPVLRQLGLVVVPSLWEASSLISMEAMTAGVPVLGSDCPGLREVLRGTPSRTVAAGDADALRHGLYLALTRPWTEAARSFAAAARSRFDVVRSTQRLLDLFDRLTGKGSGVRGQGSEQAQAPVAA